MGPRHVSRYCTAEASSGVRVMRSAGSARSEGPQVREEGRGAIRAAGRSPGESRGGVVRVSHPLPGVAVIEGATAEKGAGWASEPSVSGGGENTPCSRAGGAVPREARKVVSQEGVGRTQPSRKSPARSRSVGASTSAGSVVTSLGRVAVIS